MEGRGRLYGQSYLPTEAENAPIATRRIQWWYLGPVIGAPIAHVLVSSLGKVRTSRGRGLVIAGIVMSTTTMIANRVFMLGHSNYAEEERDPSKRVSGSGAL